MATIQEYKDYIWKKLKSGEITESDILKVKSNTKNKNWNMAIKAAQDWVVKNTTSKPYTESPSKSENKKFSKVQGKKGHQLEPEIAKAILNTDKRAKSRPGSRPKDHSRKSFPRSMGKRLH